MHCFKVYFSDLLMKVYCCPDGLYKSITYSDLLGISKSLSFSDVMKYTLSELPEMELFGEKVIDFLLLNVIGEEASGDYTRKLDEIKKICNITIAIDCKNYDYKNKVSYMFLHQFEVIDEHGDNRNDLYSSDKHATDQANNVISEVSRYDQGNENGNDFCSNNYLGLQVNDYSPIVSDNVNSEPYDCFSEQNIGGTKVTLQESSLNITCSKSSLNHPFIISLPIFPGYHASNFVMNHTFEVIVIVDNSASCSLNLLLNEDSKKIDVACFLKDNQVNVSGRVDDSIVVSGVCSELSESDFRSVFTTFWIV